jgi:hypothetical protein
MVCGMWCLVFGVGWLVALLWECRVVWGMLSCNDLNLRAN